MSNYNDFANYYDILTQNIDYDKRAGYFHSLISKFQRDDAGNILLDLGCGTGTLMFLMEQKGYDVIGVDNSYSMLSVAMTKKAISTVKSSAVILCQEMSDLDMFGTLNVVVSALDSLNHIVDKDELMQVFNKVSLFLEKDGLFIFDVNTVYKHEHILNGSTFVYDYDEVYCVWQNSNLLDNNIIDISLDMFCLDEETNLYDRFYESFSERAYSHEEILEFITNSGLTLLACYDADLDSIENVTDTTQRVVYIAKK